MQFPKFGHKSHDVHYQVKPSNPQAHYFTVKLQIAQPEAKQQVYMPAWIPGSYKIRDFSQYITWIKAYDKSGEIKITQIDKGTWQLAQASGQITIEYQVYAYDLSVRGSYLDTTRGFFNGPSMYLAVKGQEQAPCSVDILAPEDKQLKQWRVATALETHGAKSYGFGKYHASDYDELIDHPVEMGEFDLIEFDVMGVPHAMAITGKHRADTGRLAKDLKKVCTQHARMFGGVPKDIKKYIFLTTVVGEGYGGLEHRSSCSLIIKRENLPHKNNPEASDKYAIFLSLCSHEYFHTWNVKRIRPAAFMPFDYQKENYTQLLWVFEGITSYYDDLALLRSGLIDVDGYLELLSQMITRVLRSKGRFRQTVAESSYYAWTKFYKPDENSVNAVVSYYAKGALIALGLDLQIRANTGNQYSLDAVMLELWSDYGKQDKGVGENTFEEIACKVGGQDLRQFFDQAVRGTGDLPLQEWLTVYGINLFLRASESSNDKGGKPLSKVPQAEMGITLKEEAGMVRVLTVGEGTPAQKAGVWAGDLIVACNGLKASAKRIATELAHAEPGYQFILHVFRGDELLVFSPILRAAEQTTCYLLLNPDVDQQQQVARAAWLTA